MGYGQVSKVEETTGGGKYINPGISEVGFKAIEHKDITGPNYSGEVGDVVIVDNQGREHNKRIFPYKYSDKFIIKEVLQTEEQQWEIYNKKMKHLFHNSVSEEKFDKTMTKATDFKSFIELLASICVLDKGGDKFRCKFIADKNGYTRTPDRTWGVTEKLSVNPSKLTFDAVSEGKKAVVNAEVADDSAPDDLPF